MIINCSGGYFSACHFIFFENGFCEPLHGHNFHVEATIDAPLNEAGYTVDFLVVNEALKSILQPWRERVLLPRNNLDFSIERNGSQFEISYTQPDGSPLFWSIPAEHCVILDVKNTTTELIARTIAKRFWMRLSLEMSSLTWVEIRLEETPGCVAVCRIPPPQ